MVQANGCGRTNIGKLNNSCERGDTAITAITARKRHDANNDTLNLQPVQQQSKKA
jgi:hypothetical protein